MKILMPVHYFLPKHQAGAEIYTYNLAKELRKKYDVIVLYTEKDDRIKDYSVIRGEYEDIPFYKIINNHDYSSFEETYNNPKIDDIFQRILDEIKPDILHIQHLMGLSTNVISIAKKMGIPVVFTLHEYWLMCPVNGHRFKKGISNSIQRDPNICFDVNPDRCARCMVRFSRMGIIAERCYRLLKKKVSGPSGNDNSSSGSVNKNGAVTDRKRLSRSFDKFIKEFVDQALWTAVRTDYAAMVRSRLAHIMDACRDVDIFIAPSLFLKSEFVKFGISEERIVFSDNGMNLGYYTGITTKIKSDRIRFSFIGSPVIHKGVHVLIEAFNGIDDHRPELNIYGDLSLQPEYSDNLIRMARNPNIHFRGRFENKQIGKILSETDVIVVPSVWFENSPLTIHEAFLTGTPVITSRLGGMVELVRDGINGLLFNVGDADDLRVKMLSIIQEPELIERLKKGIPKVKTIEEDALFIEKLYAKLLNGK